MHTGTASVYGKTFQHDLGRETGNFWKLNDRRRGYVRQSHGNRGRVSKFKK